MVEQSFTATFKSQKREPGQEVVYKVELVDKKNVNINQKFGTSTGKQCVHLFSMLHSCDALEGYLGILAK